MEIFGIGPLELLFIILIALVVLGPKDMMNSAKKAAGWIKKIRQSEVWESTKEVMDIPNQVMHETGLDKEIQELQKVSKPFTGRSVWQPTPISSKSEIKAENAPIEGKISERSTDESSADLAQQEIEKSPENEK